MLSRRSALLAMIFVPSVAWRADAADAAGILPIIITAPHGGR
jgi:hypothetical protein